ncbi:BamA/TamA family outer membrane protein [Pseudodesulfovibrio mercurii]|uniref:BamA/TamA family outer membrane protein n=1 Tax=Pseudodesulfovibrio mercurii TaxID=641491 RepID=UPI0002F44F4C|nr:BamA/TamA family outer membrane protein [Pseudodesulfovibrio mercurii]
MLPLLWLAWAVLAGPVPVRAESFGPALIRKAGPETDTTGGDAKEQGDEDGEEKPTRSILVPFAFRSDLVGLAVGIGGGITGFQDGQMSVAGTGYVSTQKAAVVIGAVSNYRVWNTERIFLDTIGSLGTYPHLWIFSGSDGAGNNASQKTDRLSGRGHDNWLEAKFKYVLPWGGGADDPIADYRLRDGMLVAGATGGGDWNPLKGGLTYLDVTPFYRDQTIKESDSEPVVYETAGVRLGLRHDNTDFPLNPTTGSKQKIALSQGFDVMADSVNWTALEGEWSRFFSLGPSDSARQRVIGIDVWTVGTLSGQRPPPFEGATLGGIDRMRGFDNNRFNDRAALYYGFEYRYMPRWNPLKNLRLAKVDWVQVTLFGELGRVADEWNLLTLNKDMKYDAGVRFSALINDYLGRADFAFSPETWHIRVMVGLPF